MTIIHNKKKMKILFFYNIKLLNKTIQYLDYIKTVM